MFTTSYTPNSTWSRTVHGRGKRGLNTNLGFYVVEHISTGKLITGISKSVSVSVDVTISQLLTGQYPNKAMCKLVSMCPDLKLYEYSTATLTEAKVAIKQLRSSVTPTYLILD